MARIARWAPSRGVQVYKNQAAIVLLLALVTGRVASRPALAVEPVNAARHPYGRIRPFFAVFESDARRKVSRGFPGTGRRPGFVAPLQVRNELTKLVQAANIT